MPLSSWLVCSSYSIWFWNKPLLDVITSVASGGVIGVIGTLISGGVSILKNKQDSKRLVEERKLDLEEMRLEGVIAERQQALATAEAQANAEADIRVASYKEAGRSLYKGDSLLLQIADFIRAITRPALLIYLAVITARIYETSTGADQQLVINTILFLFTAAGTWYFGSRQMQKGL